MLATRHTAALDRLTAALARKARSSESGGIEQHIVGSGDGWRAVDLVCTSGPQDRAFEERQASVAISVVLSGTFSYRSDRGASLMSPGALLLMNAGQVFECAHEHGEGDRCLSFQFEPDAFARLTSEMSEVGASPTVFAHDRLPPLRALAPLVARAETALHRRESLEEIALDLAGSVVALAGFTKSETRRTAPPDPARIALVLRYLESRTAESHALGDLARIAGMSRYHFLRTFRAVTGITPHQWLLRARLRDAARRLAVTRTPITEVALDVGFADLSNFIRSFRAEFGISPRRYRAAA